ncbi:helix-turn-helix transcriptional regulator [Microbulbifer sp. SSSA005]|uniref:helix-turn-helix transcriptional regulator n=1 Tax=Microbulbifer sp. SSSA005 TaxID=3243378 RepID=UPI004039DB9D
MKRKDTEEVNLVVNSMIAPRQKDLDTHIRQNVLFESQYLGDLFRFQKILVSPNGNVSIGFSSDFNLTMVISGVADINSDACEFPMASGEIWLSSEMSHVTVDNLSEGDDLIIICASISPVMLTRFYERHTHVLIKAKNALASSVTTLPKSGPFVFPECDLTRFTLDSLSAFSKLNDESLNYLKLEELLLLKLKGACGCRLADELLRQVNPVNERFRRFMEENATQHWSVANYAKQIGMSLTSFKNKFGQVFKAESPKAWINERRLQHADIQLKTTNKRLVDIALESGFSSQSYFTQLYKSMYGYPPSEVRQKSVKSA